MTVFRNVVHLLFFLLGHVLGHQGSAQFGTFHRGIVSDSANLKWNPVKCYRGKILNMVLTSGIILKTQFCVSLLAWTPTPTSVGLAKILQLWPVPFIGSQGMSTEGERLYVRRHLNH